VVVEWLGDFSTPVRIVVANRAFEAIAKKYGGRPHWAKRFYSTAEELKEV
jgi:hypothetical protein